MFHRLSISSSTMAFATLLLASGTTGFTLPSTTTTSSMSSRSVAGNRLAAIHPYEKNTFIDAIVDGEASTTSSFDPLNLSSEEASSRIIASNVSNNHERNNHSAAASSILAASILMSSTPFAAHAAAGPDWGIFEGRTGSLLHPIAMFSMAALSASTALLGFQWRRQRTLGDEIAALKKTLPVLKDGATSVKEALAAATSMDEVDASYVSALKGALETENQIAELTKERKDLANASPRDKHFNQGSLILFLGIAFAIEVCTTMPLSSLFRCCSSLHPISTILILTPNILFSHHPILLIHLGSTQHLRSCRETLSRSTLVCRCGSSSTLGTGRVNGPIDAKGK